MTVRLFLLLFLLFATARTAYAVPLSDLVNGGRVMTSNGLTFTNFHATLTYREFFPGAVQGLITTRQATLADLQLTPFSSPSNQDGFEVSGFAWEGTAERSSLSGSPQTPPLEMSLTLNYTVMGLGDVRLDTGPRMVPGHAVSIGADAFHSLDVTTPTGEQAYAEFCIALSCHRRVDFLPVGTTEATVRDFLKINPFQECQPGFMNCTFHIESGEGIPFAGSFASFQASRTPIPEPSTAVLVTTAVLVWAWREGFLLAVRHVTGKVARDVAGRTGLFLAVVVLVATVHTAPSVVKIT
ncbi:hypothetical protein [Nitrospira sp. Nam74]